MRPVTEFVVLDGDRCTAMEVARAALRTTGHHVADRDDGGFIACSGSRLLTTLLGALVPEAREFRCYLLSVTTNGGRSTLALRHAGHGTATVGGEIGRARRAAAWRRVTSGLEDALRAAGVFAHRVDRPYGDRG